MASLEDYDEFGNYIGADLESDEEEETRVPEQRYEALEGMEEEAVVEEEMALMQVDGMHFKHAASRKY